MNELLNLDPSDCPRCAKAAGKSGGIYNFGPDIICCRVRFLLGLPTLELRRGWLERWRDQKGGEFVDKIKAELRKKWKPAINDEEV